MTTPLNLYYDKDNVVKAASTKHIVTNLYRSVTVKRPQIMDNPIGKKIRFGGASHHLRVAVICNWGDACGIATYSKFLVDALRPLVTDIKIFAENSAFGTEELEQGDACGIQVERCWQRGKSMADAIRRVVAWKPTIVLIQHEFGIFPKAPYLLQMFQMLDEASIPYVVTLHSVYEHLDKVVCSSAMKNVVVHSTTGEACLRQLGHTNNIRVIPHGCILHDEVMENWNITQTPYALMQFGFGFKYKGVEVVLEAIASLKQRFPKRYGGETPLHYLYLCSESPHLKNVNNEYSRMLLRRIRELGLEDNAVILQGFQTEEVLNQYLRTYKLAVFPYVEDARNVVYGASGAARIAMANRIPVIVSRSHMFDDVEGVLPRSGNSEELANEIDKIFSNHTYRDRIIKQADVYTRQNSWAATAAHYRNFFQELVAANTRGTIVISDSETNDLNF